MSPEQNKVPQEAGKVVLSKPLDIDGQPITEITLREPLAAELYGVPLLSVVQLDPAAHGPLIEKLSTPTVPEAAFMQMSARDMSRLMGRVASFFG
ncbi:MAG: phage tail assembly protein [Gammaproteobacteria bacterium]|nr:phage tail assembly protein [Gammaproteobacteria bacterium]